MNEPPGIPKDINERWNLGNISTIYDCQQEQEVIKHILRGGNGFVCVWSLLGRWSKYDILTGISSDDLISVNTLKFVLLMIFSLW